MRVRAALRYVWSAPGWIAACLLIAFTVIAYLPVWNAGFIWDDDSWTTGIEKLLASWDGLRRIWFQPGATQQFYPFTATTFWLDYQLWGMTPRPCHVENVLMHAAAALLVWRLLFQIEVPGAWLSAAIFALHPVMVESVAWITERKNVLSLLLFVGASLSYGRYTHGWKAAGKAGDEKWYVIAFLLFLGATLAKITACVWPAVVLLLLWWKNGGFRWLRHLLPLAPFFLVAVVSGVGIAWVEQVYVGARGRDFEFTFAERCLIAGRALWFYPAKLLWPAHQCFVYTPWQLDTGNVKQWIYPVAALAALCLLWVTRNRIGRGPITAALFYAGTIFPALGFLNAYFMRYSFVWDHLTYLPSLGLIVLGSAALSEGMRRSRYPELLPIFAAAGLTALGVLTWRQCWMYKDNETLWRTTIARCPDAFMPHNNLGGLLTRQGKFDEALAEFRKVIALKPDYEVAHYNVGFALLRKERIDEAIAHFQEALELNPSYARAHFDLANSFMVKGAVGDAIAHYAAAWEAEPTNPEPAYRLAWLLATTPDPSLRDGAKALEFAQKADWLGAGKNPSYGGSLAAAYAEVGRFTEAVSAAERAIQIARSQNKAAAAEALEDQLALYRGGIPFRDTTQMKAPVGPR